MIGFMGFEAARAEWSFSVNHVMTLRSAAGILAQAFAKRPPRSGSPSRPPRPAHRAAQPLELPRGAASGRS